jgi:hypothetical protein
VGPKPRGGWRRFAILSRRDVHTWNALAGRVARRLEPRLDQRVAANRAVVGTNGWRLESAAGGLRRARVLAPRSGLLLRTDVKEFYSSITPPVLIEVLSDLGVSRDDSRLVGDMVDAWSESGYSGLPIGPPGSAVLANAVLVQVDHALDPLAFVRWVDDYLIAVASEQAAADILHTMDEALSRVGLQRSAPKTELIEGIRSVAWLRGRPPAFFSRTNP